MQHIAATPGYAGSSWPREIAACRAEIVRAITTPPPEIARFLDRTVERRRSAVLGVAAIEKNEISWTAAVGGGDEAVFQAGSLSKTVTAAVALELVARGQLELDGETRGTTVRDLLGHTAGANVPFYPGYPQGEPVPTLAQALEGAEPATTPAVELDPKAAGRFRYSGGGYAIVQQLIEGVTGEPFAETARRLVFEPLGMAQSSFAQPPESLGTSAAWADWRIYPEQAAAGLWTTPADLSRFVCALLTGRMGTQMTISRVKLPRWGQWTALGLLGLSFRARPASERSPTLRVGTTSEPLAEGRGAGPRISFSGPCPSGARSGGRVGGPSGRLRRL